MFLDLTSPKRFDHYHRPYLITLFSLVQRKIDQIIFVYTPQYPSSLSCSRIASTNSATVYATGDMFKFLLNSIIWGGCNPARSNKLRLLKTDSLVQIGRA